MADLIDQVVYSGTLALLAFIPAAISQMTSFYLKERYRPSGAAEMAWFRRFTLLLTASLWAILISHILALEELISWSNTSNWTDLSSISVGLLTVTLTGIVIAYSTYILLFFNRLDWGQQTLSRFSGPNND